MAENKDYWNEEMDGGSVKIAESVVASIAATAIKDVAGVDSMSSGISADIAGLLGKKQVARGIKTRFSDKTVEIDVFIVVKYGYVINDVASEVQKSVKFAVESMTGIKVSGVNVEVNGIAFPTAEPQPEEPVEK